MFLTAAEDLSIAMPVACLLHDRFGVATGIEEIVHASLSTDYRLRANPSTNEQYLSGLRGLASSHVADPNMPLHRLSSSSMIP